MSKTFPFTAGRLCLSFLATVGNRGSQPFERLETPHDLSRWLIQAGLAQELLTLTSSQLHAAQTLREGIYRVAVARLHQQMPASADREQLNTWAAYPPLAPQLSSDDWTYQWKAQDVLDAALATITRDAVLLLTSPEAERIKVCEEPLCAMLFLDTSRAGQRRWCSMNVCGNRAKKLNYRQGHQ